MIIRCPKCGQAYEYDDVFHADSVLTRGSQADWQCDECKEKFTLQVEFMEKP